MSNYQKPISLYRLPFKVRLQQRIHSYLEQNLEERYVDMERICDELCKIPEYRRYKRRQFVILIQSTMNNLTKSLIRRQKKEFDVGIISEDESDFEEEIEATKVGFKSDVNQVLSNMYSVSSSHLCAKMGKKDKTQSLRDDTARNESKINTEMPKILLENVCELENSKESLCQSDTRDYVEIVEDDDCQKNSTNKICENGGLKNRNAFAANSTVKNNFVVLKNGNDGINGNNKVVTSDKSSRLGDASFQKISAVKRQLTSKQGSTSIEFSVENSSVTFDNVGGCDRIVGELCDVMDRAFNEAYHLLGSRPLHGLLLYGPPGSGKTLLANAVGGSFGIGLIRIVATELVSGVSGDSEALLRRLFEAAINAAPCIVFIDEIDAIAQKRENSHKDMERRIVSQLLSCFDELDSIEMSPRVLIIAATNQPDNLDPALRRAGRFGREIGLGMPDESARRQILTILIKSFTLDICVDLDRLAKITPGFVGADIRELCEEAVSCAIKRIRHTLQTHWKRPEDVENEKDESWRLRVAWLKSYNSSRNYPTDIFSIKMIDFEEAIKIVQPSSKREGFATVPDVTFDDIGALSDVREELEMSILGPINHPTVFNSLGISNPTGILLCGPPGCGKTLLAKAVANQAGINFISIKGPEIVNKYVGESEHGVRKVFARARDSAPCVIFFDEIDSLCPRRSEAGSSDGGASNRLVNQLLTEMDGIGSKKGVYLLAATNRIDIIDPAIKRPGRLDKIIYVGLPNVEDREAILYTITQGGVRPQLATDVRIHDIAQDPRIQGFSGADLAALVTEAAKSAAKNYLRLANEAANEASSTSSLVIEVKNSDFEFAFEQVKPSVNTARDRMMYENMKAKYGIGRFSPFQKCELTKKARIELDDEGQIAQDSS